LTDIVEVRVSDLDSKESVAIFREWLEAFAAALEENSSSTLGELLADDVTWRDLMAFEWDFMNRIDRDAVATRLIELSQKWSADDFTVSADQEAHVVEGVIRGFFDFTTKDRLDRGYVVLKQAGGRFIAVTLQTEVASLQNHPELTGARRPEGKVYGVVPGRTRWKDDREKTAAFEDAEPAVLVLGAGHNGLAVAARLGALGVSALVIDREQRVGDQWRKRYAALALHSSVFGDHLPYLPMPQTWTAHTPKDKWADWLESYATLMDINVWTGTEYVSGDYDDERHVWTIRVRRADGSIRELHPRHFFVAGGMFGAPKYPAVQGLHTFAGEVLHSDNFQDGSSFSGKKTLVIGAGVSAHEIAHDLYEHGADVTMLQRSATYVVSYEAYHKFWNRLFSEEMAYSNEIADQIAYAVPYPRTDAIHKQLVIDAAKWDQKLHNRLIAAGFKLEWGPDGTGIQGSRAAGRDSYQIDIGASGLVADGEIHLKQGVELAELKNNTAVFSDGTELSDLDLVVFATGYHQFWGHIKPTLGSAAAKIDKADSRADDGETANTWRRSAQPGLWFGSGFIRMARYYSNFSALLIKAIEEGIEPIDPAQVAKTGTADPSQLLMGVKN
jgi:putative flavoprotein involved in K+ transport